MRLRAPGAVTLPRSALCLAVVAMVLWVAAAPLRAEESADTIDLVHVGGVVDPTVAEYLHDRLLSAARDGVQAVILQLDTPGGLDVSVPALTRQMLASEVPIVVWIAPRGARAASAGTFIAYAAGLVFMAGSTEIGPATPVNLAGDGPEARHASADAAAFIRHLAATTGRDAGRAEHAVGGAAALDASEAARLHVVDGLASSLRRLLQVIDGTRVRTSDGRSRALETWDEAGGAPSVVVRFQEMNVVQRLLHSVISPEVAFLLLLAGAFGVIFELYNPGIGLAAILGIAALLLAFYALSVLPANWIGVALIVLSIVLLVVDLQAAGLGVWTIGGLVSLVAGGVVLFSGAPPPLELSPWALLAAVATTLLFFVSVMTAALRVRLRRPVSDEAGIVGVVGEAQTDIAPEGTVLTKGTIWRARTMETGIAAGSRVKVMATEGLVLLVEPLEEGRPDLGRD